MQTYRFSLRPLSAFGTPLAGDTLFGQLCWTLRRQMGNSRLVELLEGYTNAQPFAVVADALPRGYVPLPNVPSDLWQATESSVSADRKSLKKRKWLKSSDLVLPFSQWQSVALTDADLTPDAMHSVNRAQPHNSINRRTGTTGEGAFAPYVASQIWFHPDTQFDLYVVIDDSRLGLSEITDALAYIGLSGYGRDASAGLGKFELLGDGEVFKADAVANANSYLTLGPCAPQGLGFCPVRSTYQVVTRFGRHGDAAVQTGHPFKRPVLLAKAGSVFWPDTIDISRQFIGQGIGGVNNPVSTAMPETVHQGYAPVIPISRTTETIQ